MRRSLRRTVLACGLALGLTACDEETRPPPTLLIPPEKPTQTEPATDPTAAANAPESADAGADAGVSLAQVAGEWEGAYDAKKGRVGMPSGVQDPGRAADDGKAVSGSGSVKLTVKPTGDVEGKSRGALGDATIRGKIDGKMLRASFMPDDMAAPHAMSGVLVGIVRGDKIEAELRVAGPDAILVRQSNFDIKKNP